MLKDTAIPFVNENLKMKDALKILSSKKLGFLLVRDKKNNTKGIITDGELRRFSQKNQNLHSVLVKEIMTKNPISIPKELLVSEALELINKQGVQGLFITNNEKKPLGFVHFHDLIKVIKN